MAASIGLQDGLGTTFHTSFVCTVQASFRCTVNRRLTLDLRNLQDLSDFLTAFCLTMPLSQISKYLTCHTSPIYTGSGPRDGTGRRNSSSVSGSSTACCWARHGCADCHCCGVPTLLGCMHGLVALGPQRSQVLPNLLSGQHAASVGPLS